MGAYEMTEHSDDFVAQFEVLHLCSDLHDLSSHIGRCHRKKGQFLQNNQTNRICFRQKLKQTARTTIEDRIEDRFRMNSTRDRLGREESDRAVPISVPGM